MRIKKFTANNYADALEQVKKELGDEALIMSTRSIKPNTPLSGRNAASKVEITDFTKEWYFGNGTITPERVTYQSGGVL